MARGWPRPSEPKVGTFGPTARGGVYVLLACWWGNGLPRLRWVAGLGGCPATLGLRHCPDSYGRLQSRIIRNGRKPDGATPRGRRRPSGCKVLSRSRKIEVLIPPSLTLLRKEAPANFVPAAAVRRRERALFGITGHKGHAGGLVSWM